MKVTFFIIIVFIFAIFKNVYWINKVFQLWIYVKNSQLKIIVMIHFTVMTIVVVVVHLDIVAKMFLIYWIKNHVKIINIKPQTLFYQQTIEIE